MVGFDESVQISKGRVKRQKKVTTRSNGKKQVKERGRLRHQVMKTKRMVEPIKRKKIKGRGRLGLQIMIHVSKTMTLYLFCSICQFSPHT